VHMITVPHRRQKRVSSVKGGGMTIVKHAAADQQGSSGMPASQKSMKFLHALRLDLEAAGCKYLTTQAQSHSYLLIAPLLSPSWAQTS